MAVGAGLARRPLRRPEVGGVLGAAHRRIVRGVEVVAEADRPRPSGRIALRARLGGQRALLRLQEGHHVNDVLRLQHAVRAPRRHQALRKEVPRVVDHVEDVLIPQVPVAIRREIRPDAARRPDVLTLDQVTARARPQVPVEEEPSPLRGIARPRGHDGFARGGLGAPIVIGIGAKLPEVLGAPPAITQGLAAAVRPGRHVSPGLDERARDPGSRRQPEGGRPSRRHGVPLGAASRHQRGGDDPRARRKGRRMLFQHSAQANLMSAMPSYLPPCVSRKVTLSWPGSVARTAKEKKGFSLTDWEVSNWAISRPR